MAVIRRQIPANSTAPILLKLEDIEGGGPVLPDALPTVEVFNPTSRRVVYGENSIAVGGGGYLYKVPARATTILGFYKVLFTYSIQREVYKTDFVFEVI